MLTDVLSLRTFLLSVSTDVLSLWTFCPHGRFVCRTFCPYRRFVSTDVLSLQTFCPTDVMSPDVLSPDVLSPDVLSPDILSLWTFCLQMFCLGTVYTPGDSQTTPEYPSQSVQCLYINQLLSINEVVLSYLLLLLLLHNNLHTTKFIHNIFY